MTFNPMRTIFLSAALLATSTVAISAQYQGTVANVTPYNGKVYVVVSNGNFSGDAGSCPAGNAMIYIIDPATPFGQSLVAVALSAKLTGRLVWAVGDGVCSGGSPYGLGEGLSGMDLKG